MVYMVHMSAVPYRNSVGGSSGLYKQVLMLLALNIVDPCFEAQQ